MLNRIGKGLVLSRSVTVTRGDSHRYVGAFLLICASLAFLLTASLVYAQEEPQVSISIDKESVLLGDSVLLTVTENGIKDPEMPSLPEIPNFDVKFRGTRQEAFSNFTMIIQGKTVQQKQSGGGIHFDFELIPKQVGEFVIPSFTITASGKTYPTKPFRIEVVDQSVKSQDIFLLVEADKLETYVGEKILLTFKWYFRTDIAGYRLVIPWLDGAKNFVVTDPVLDPNLRYQRLIVNDNVQVASQKTTEFYKGQQYAVISFEKILTPLSSGTFPLESSFIKCDVVTGYKTQRQGSFFDDFFGADFNNFFGGRQALTAPFSTRSEPLEISVLDVPAESRPASYSGAVGDFNFDVAVRPAQLKAGEPITVTMTVSGVGNFETLKLPVMPEVEGFRSYEPESKTNLAPSQGAMKGEKIFERVLIPKKEGHYEIPAVSFTFFDPRKKDYQTITRGPFAIEAEKGSEAEREPQVVAALPALDRTGASQEIKLLKQDIRYIKTELGPVKKQTTPFYLGIVPWLIGFVLPALIVTGLGLWQANRERYVRDIRFARHKRAFRNIKGYLDEAVSALKGQDSRKFYDALSKAVTQFVADKLNRPRASISQDIVGELSAKGLDSASADALKKLFQTFDSAIFSFEKTDTKKLESDLKLTHGLISALERMLK